MNARAVAGVPVDAIRSNGLEERADDPVVRLADDHAAKRLDPRIETVALVRQFGGADCDNLFSAGRNAGLPDDTGHPALWRLGISAAPRAAVQDPVSTHL